MFLSASGLGIAGLAGCLESQPTNAPDPDPDADVVVTDTRIIHRSGDDRFEYPDDVMVRVSVENNAGERKQRTLVVTLRRNSDPEEGSDSEHQLTDEIDLSHASSIQKHYVFEGVFDERRHDIDEFVIETELREDG